MKTIKRTFLFALCALFFANVHTLNAQVTIGSELEPNAGALLDLKQDATSPGANSSKGFNLPRVALTGLNSLDPCAADTDANKKSHTGLTVYNTTSDDNFIPGTYVWNGNSWVTSSQRPKRVDPNLTDLGVTEIEAGTYANVASFVISESGYYAINTTIMAVRTSNVNSYFNTSIKGNNYSFHLGAYLATTAHGGIWTMAVFRTYIDYLEAGTYYLIISVSNDVKWRYNHNNTFLSLVKLSN